MQSNSDLKAQQIFITSLWKIEA